jgi:hypothetical protein
VLLHGHLFQLSGAGRAPESLSIDATLRDEASIRRLKERGSAYGSAREGAATWSTYVCGKLSVHLAPLLYTGETEEENMTNGHLTFFDAPKRARSRLTRHLIAPHLAANGQVAYCRDCSICHTYVTVRRQLRVGFSYWWTDGSNAACHQIGGSLWKG